MGDHPDAPDVLRALVAAGAKVDAKDAYGWTALAQAAMSSYLRTVETLIELGVRIPKDLIAEVPNQEMKLLLSTRLRSRDDR